MNEIEAAYVAGFIDGEGCLLISPEHKIVMKVSNTALPVLEWIQVRSGGQIDPVKVYGKRKPQWVLRWRYAEQRVLLPRVIPHLKTKKDAAVLLLNELEQKGYNDEH